MLSSSCTGCQYVSTSRLGAETEGIGLRRGLLVLIGVGAAGMIIMGLSGSGAFDPPPQRRRKSRK